MPPGGGPAHGLGVRRTTFDAVLVDAVREEPRASVREGERVTGLLRDAAATVIGVTTTAGEITARIVVAADGLHSPIRAWSGLSDATSGAMRYGVAGHWRLAKGDRDAVIVTLAGSHEWYEAPVGPDLLLVSILSHRTRRPVTARDYAPAARRSIPALRDAELVSGPLGAAHFHQRVRAVVAGGGVFLVGDASGLRRSDHGRRDRDRDAPRRAPGGARERFLSGRISSVVAAARYAGDQGSWCASGAG